LTKDPPLMICLPYDHIQFENFNSLGKYITSTSYTGIGINLQ